ncbi:MAG: hypothetical protein Q8L69_16415 [Gallionellaceae bacterium]|nr:hypothetical protein [Gallionellaceae bacterium]
MRYVSSISDAATYVEEREVKRTSHVRAIKPISDNERRAPVAEHPKGLHESLHEERREVRAERRKICRRVSNQTVLIKLRSSIDRRQRNLRQSDIVEHVNEKV